MSSPEQHVETMDMVFPICRMTLAINPEQLADLINQCSFAAAAGPVFDPAGIVESWRTLAETKPTIEAFAEFKRKITRMYDEEMDRVEKITGVNHRAAEEAEEAEVQK